MFIIFNKDGSIFAKTQSDYVMQGSNRVNKVFVAFLDSEYKSWSCSGVFNLPNGTRWTIPATTSRFEYLGQQYEGWCIELTDDVTKYAGQVSMTVMVVSDETQVAYTYLANIVINQTGLPLDGYWDSSITVAQFNSYMAQLAVKLQANTVSVELSENDIPEVGELNVLYFIVGATSDTPYQVKMWNGSDYVLLGTINLSSFASREEQAEFEARILELQSQFQEEINQELVDIRNELANPFVVVATESELPSTDEGKIYIVTANNNWYYWNGTAYVSGGEFTEAGLTIEEITDYTVLNQAFYTYIQTRYNNGDHRPFRMNVQGVATWNGDTNQPQPIGNVFGWYDTEQLDVIIVSNSGICAIDDSYETRPIVSTSPLAEKVIYDNTESGLDATNVQSAIDGLKDFVVNDNLVGFKNVRLSGTTQYLYDGWIYIPYSKLTTNILTMLFSNQAQENIAGNNLNVAYYNEAKEKISDHEWVAGYWLTLSEFSINLTPPENTYYVGIRVFCRGDADVQKSASVDIVFLNETERKISLNENIKVICDSVFSLDSSNAIKNSSVTKYITSNDNEKLLEVLKAGFVNGKRWYAANVGEKIKYQDFSNSAASGKLIFDKDVIINSYKDNPYYFNIYEIDENGIVLAKYAYREAFKLNANTIYLLHYQFKEEDGAFQRAINGLDIVNDDLEPFKDLYITYGTINSADGLHSFKSSNARIVSYKLDIDFIEYMTINNEANDRFLYIFCFDENDNYLGNAGNGLDGFQLFSKNYVFKTYPTTKYIRLLFGLDDGTQPELSVFNQYVDLYFTKEGLEKYKQEQEKILLRRAKFDKKFQSIAYSKTNDNTAPINSKQQYIAAGKNVGYTAIKGDIRITSDNKLIMCHDEGYTFDTNGRIITFDSTNYTPIRDLTYAQVMSLEFAQQYEGQYVHPTDIDGLLQTCKKYGKTPYIVIRNEYIDIYVPILVNKIKEYYLEEDCIVNSYTLEAITEVRKYSEKIILSRVYADNTIPNQGEIDVLNELGNAVMCFVVVHDYSLFDSDEAIAYIQKMRDVEMRFYNAIAGNVEELNTLVEKGFSGAQTYIPFIDE